MFRNYLKSTVRNLLKNKTHSLINIAGLSVGMAVAMLIGLWIWNELSFNKPHTNYDRIALVMRKGLINGSTVTSKVTPVPLEAELHKSYGSDFKHVVITSWTGSHVLAAGDKKLSSIGNFMGAEGPEMFTLKMIKGDYNGLQGTSSMMLSQSIATALFGSEDAMGKVIKLDNDAVFTVSGVYEDIPENSQFHEVTFIAPWQFFQQHVLAKDAAQNWTDNSYKLYVQVADNADMNKVSDKIKDVILSHSSQAETVSKPALFLHPMSKWYLYSKFENGINTGGAIQYVWLFGIIGVFVLLLACINFMNLSTARSEKRAKEVGVRKAIGSLRAQLVGQFYFESILMAILAFIVALLLASMALPFFNVIAGKKMAMLWSNIPFWLMSFAFVLFTGFIAGSYPALYLSSFKPVKVLKGTFKAGRMAAVPRQVLVVLQFSVSVILIISTVVVFKQVQFAKNRPVGYSREGLVNIEMVTDDLYKHFNAVRTDLLESGLITAVAESSSPATAVYNNRGDVNWNGKDPDRTVDFANVRISTDFGKAMGWQFVQGRDFSTQFATDSSAIVLNEASVKYMGLKNPVGETVRMGNRSFTVIGVIKDMVMASPYEPVKQTLFYMNSEGFYYLNVRINPTISAHEAIDKIAAVCKTYSPSVPFAYSFADDEYAKKFDAEERIGTLAGFFATLAVFISCLGLFGMASFMAEQRIKEIGVRKILGASVLNLWAHLSRDFVVLVIIALLVAIPAAYYYMHTWLQNYSYHTEISWWIFIAAAAGAILITLLTVSYQSIKAALTNPVKSLRAE